jgi:hypothetical protein
MKPAFVSIESLWSLPNLVFVLFIIFQLFKCYDVKLPGKLKHTLKGIISIEKIGNLKQLLEFKIKIIFDRLLELANYHTSNYKQKHLSFRFNSDFIREWLTCLYEKSI